MITLASIFRNSHAYLDRYFDQIRRLRDHVDVCLVLGEGDSGDGTGDMVRRRVHFGDTVITVDHGGPRYGSVDVLDRWTNIAQVVRGVIREVDDPGEAFVWVEADLIWEPDTILELLKADIPVAPMLFASADPDRLYDTWGCRQDGKGFSPNPPYFPVNDGGGERYVPVESVGSCFIEPAREWHTVATWDGYWPFRGGGRLLMDTRSKIWHP